MCEIQFISNFVATILGLLIGFVMGWVFKPTEQGIENNG